MKTVDSRKQRVILTIAFCLDAALYLFVRALNLRLERRTLLRNRANNKRTTGAAHAQAGIVLRNRCK
jgi:hypothetical protein